MLNFDSFSLPALLMDLCYGAAFLILAQFLRRKWKVLQELYIPSSLLAGILGLLCGPQFLGVVRYSPAVSSYAGILVILLFATLTLGHKEKAKKSAMQTIAGVRDTFFLHLIAGFSQYGLGILLGIALVKVFWPGMYESIGILAPAGFAGGHGSASTIGQILEAQGGFAGATGIGITFATIGLLSGILLGMVNINIAVRIGAAKYTKHLDPKLRETGSGWIPEEKRGSLGPAVMSPGTIDPLGWHFCVVLLCAGCGYWLNQVVPAVAGIRLPAMCYAALTGLVVQKGMDMLRLGSYINKQNTNRISGTTTDLLVFFGTASLDVRVVLDYMGPILLLSLFCILWTTFVLWVLGPMVFTKGWFERSIYVFGMMNGVMATGVTLLRVIDPESKSGTLEDYGLAYAPMSWQNAIQLGVLPVLCASGAALQAGLLGVGIALLAFLFSWLTHTAHPWKREYLNSEQFEAAMKKGGYQ